MVKTLFSLSPSPVTYYVYRSPLLTVFSIWRVGGEILDPILCGYWGHTIILISHNPNSVALGPGMAVAIVGHDGCPLLKTTKGFSTSKGAP